MLITHDVLNVDHTLYFQTQSHFIGIVNNSFNYRFAQRTGRIYSDGVAGVYACTFNVLHNARNQNFLAVADSVNLYLGALQIMVNQNRMLCRSLYCVGHVVAQLVVVVNDFHSTTTQYVGRTYHGRIANIMSSIQCALGVEYGMSFGTGDIAVS